MRIPSSLDVPEHAMRCFEAATGLSVCCHDPGDILARFVEPRRMQHHFPLCMLVKRQRQGACDVCCVDRVRSALATHDSGVVKRCHAGLVECAVAIHAEDGRLWTVLFAGARSRGTGLDLEIDEPPGPPGPWSRTAATLPPMDEAGAVVVLEQLRQLAARLDRWRREDLPRLTGVAGAGRSRREAIHVWIQQHHRDGSGLGELARHLGLSVSRAGHAVVQACGSGFVELMNRERLRTAADLLRRSDLPVREVASASGFRNRAHFHQSFRLAMGASPAAWRRLGGG